MTDPLLPPPGDLLIISATECRDLLDLDELRAALAQALMAHSSGDADVPPRIAARSASGLVGAMPGNINGMGMAAKLVSVFPGNHGTDVPSHQGIIALFDQDNGSTLALMDGAFITAIRTAASAAVAANIAAREDAVTLAIIGAGVQGHAHARAFAGIRDWTEIRVASRNPDSAEALAGVTPNGLAVATFEEAVRGADVIALCTDSIDPVIEHAWLAPGAHVSSVGMGHEIDTATMDAAHRVLVEWRGAATNKAPAGSLELQEMNPDDVIEVGDALADRAIARGSADELTVYKSTGHAVEDIAAARLVYDAAIAVGAGVRVNI
jgi:alanine dehydrogenase